MWGSKTFNRFLGCQMFSCFISFCHFSGVKSTQVSPSWFIETCQNKPKHTKASHERKAQIEIKTRLKRLSESYSELQKKVFLFASISFCSKAYEHHKSVQEKSLIYSKDSKIVERINNIQTSVFSTSQMFHAHPFDKWSNSYFDWQIWTKLFRLFSVSRVERRFCELVLSFFFFFYQKFRPERGLEH